MGTDAVSRPTRHVLITGFGAFGEVVFNPSGAVAQALAHHPPRGWRVSAAVLPVTFAGAPLAVDRALSLVDGPVDLLLGLGVHPGHTFRIERRARAAFSSMRVDTDQALHQNTPGAPLTTSLDVAVFAQALQRAGAGAVVVSDDAGQYVCERTYHHLLSNTRTTPRCALFVHVPPEISLPHTVQAQVMRVFLEQSDLTR